MQMATLTRTGSAKQFIKRVAGIPEAQKVPTVSVKDWIEPKLANPGVRFRSFLLSMFPMITWLPRYFKKDVFTQWLMGDIIGGFTVGIVLVPQSMSYAQVATLPPEYGLYSGFICALVYAIFATSKDVVVGPVAVMALLTDDVLNHIQAAYPGVWTKPEIAAAYALYCGALILVVALLRLGWVVELIPAPAISGFMTGSALNIATRQIPTLLGIKGINTTMPIDDVLFNVFKNIMHTHLDAIWGLIGLIFLYGIRWICERLSEKYSTKERFFFLINVMRNAFVLIGSTLVAWVYCYDKVLPDGQYPIKILRKVPSGLHHIQLPNTEHNLFLALSPYLLVGVIIIFVQHMAASKSFARRNNYNIEPDQELIAVGVTNGVASCFGAYPATAFFSCSALKSKLGVFTPASGAITALVVLLAVFCFTEAFFWIPSAALSAVIIHAVLDLITPPAELISFWRLSPVELFVWLAAVLGTIFSSIENGTYASIGLSLLLLLYRLSHPRGHFLGRATIYPTGPDGGAPRVVWVPLDGNGVNNPNIKIEEPAPGVLVYRLEESLLYPNCSWFNAHIVDYVKKHIKRGREADKPTEYMWYEDRPKKNDLENQQQENATKPDLRAFVFDFSHVPQLDATGIQALNDTKGELEKWAGHHVEFHFATILAPWIRRSLIKGGFGVGRFSALDRPADVAVLAHPKENVELQEHVITIGDEGTRPPGKEVYGPIMSADTPLFHPDLHSAVEAAELEAGYEKYHDVHQESEISEVIDAEYLLTPVFGLWSLAKKGLDTAKGQIRYLYS